MMEAPTPISGPRWSGPSSRRITERIVVEGELVLHEPAHFGSGEAGEAIDLPLLVDPYDGRSPLLPGTSLAGALRAYLRARSFGYRTPLPAPHDERAKADERAGAAVRLLGGMPGDDEGAQSPLIVFDARGRRAQPSDADGARHVVALREGVALDPATRTAAEGKLFDLECWAPGTRFPLRFELLLTDEDEGAALRQALCTALDGLQHGEIPLGARTRRGYGTARVDAWHVRRYRLTEPGDLLAWLDEGADALLPLAEDERERRGVAVTDDLWAALGSQPPPDARAFVHLRAELSLDGSLLIRSGLAPSASSPDATHLQALGPDGALHPVLSGTSLAGALRARARKIARTLCPDDAEGRAARLVARLFGYGPEDGPPEATGSEAETDAPQASRLHTREHALSGAETGLVQHRIAIDRFTGGVYPGALFNEQPAFGDEATAVTIEVAVVDPADAEVGLLLLLLKDLWTGDLPLGGEQSVGRGRLQGHARGRFAEVALRRDGRVRRWRIEPDLEGDEGGAPPAAPPLLLKRYDAAEARWTRMEDPQALQDFVTALTDALRG